MKRSMPLWDYVWKYLPGKLINLETGPWKKPFGAHATNYTKARAEWKEEGERSFNCSFSLSGCMVIGQNTTYTPDVLLTREQITASVSASGVSDGQRRVGQYRVTLHAGNISLGAKPQSTDDSLALAGWEVWRGSSVEQINETDQGEAEGGCENRDQRKENVRASTWSTLFPLPLIPISLSFVSGLTQLFFILSFYFKPIIIFFFYASLVFIFLSLRMFSLACAEHCPLMSSTLNLK